GAGLAFGDPQRAVYTLTVASFVDPYAWDVGVSASYRLWSPSQKHAIPSSLPATFLQVEQLLAERSKSPILLDHVRSGDLWFGLGVRSISSPTSSEHANAQIADGSFTYAFRAPASRGDQVRSPALSTTLTLSGIYCSQPALQVNEYGIEVRTPVGGWAIADDPIYLSVRCGTRRYFTFALVTRF
ncbi:MAG TPA: hypothetical protein VMI31_03320, partial [Fimbriimonadaceae bacterium]|nr:hypothetical protein [Fimbriimonadaceae bacterium]